jgi:hypothetical protein
MTDLTSKSWMAIGETDDPNAIIESFEAEAAVTKGDPVYLTSDHKVSPAETAQDCVGIAVKSASAAETSTRSRNITRAGEDELYRRGVE